AHLQIRVPIEAGPHTVGVSFVRELWEPEGLPQPLQRGRVLTNDELYMGYASVGSVQLAGPYQIAGSAKDSASRRAIFVCHPQSTSDERGCAARILARMSRLAYRRPITKADVDTLLDFFDNGRTEGGSFDAGIQFALERMLADPRAIDTLVDDFAAQWLNLRRVGEVVVHPDVYPAFDDNLLEAFTRETELFVGSTIREDRSVLDLLRANYTFVNERLARHYGIPGIYGSRFRRMTLRNLDQRGGLLANGALLATTSYPDRTSPVLRGKWLLNNIFGLPVPPPPPGVDTILAEAKPGAVPRRSASGSRSIGRTRAVRAATP